MGRLRALVTNAHYLILKKATLRIMHGFVAHMTIEQSECATLKVILVKILKH